MWAFWLSRMPGKGDKNDRLSYYSKTPGSAVFFFINTVAIRIGTLRDFLHCCEALFLCEKKVELDQFFSS